MYKTKFKEKYLPAHLENATGEWTVVCDFPDSKLLAFNEDGLFYDPYKNKVEEYHPSNLVDKIYVVAKTQKHEDLYDIHGEWIILGTDQDFVLIEHVETGQTKSVFPSRLKLSRFEEGS